MHVFDYGATSWARGRNATAQEHDRFDNRIYLWRVHRDGLLVAEQENIVTTVGRQQSVGLWFGAVALPQYLGLDTACGVITSVTTTSVTVTGNCGAVAGEKLTLSLGIAGTQENTSAILTTTSGGGSYTYTWATPTTMTHNVGDIVVRVPTVGDAALITETDYANSYAPLARKAMASPVYSTGVATGQWYYNGGEAQFNIYGLGLFDSITNGQGNMWNHLAISIPHAAQNELTISVQVSYQ